MGQDFEKALEAEIAELEAELGRDNRFIRLQALKSVLSLYQVPRGSDGSVKPAEPPLQVRVKHLVRGGNRKSPMRLMVVDATRLYLRNRKGPVPTREILAHLERNGLEVPGNPPLNNLSAMLSNSDDFVSHGRSGWTYEPEEHPDPDLEYERARERRLEEEYERELGDGASDLLSE